MYPTLHKGDMVLIINEAYDKIRVGNLIGFVSKKGIPLVHRVVIKSAYTIQTMADVSRKPDPSINPNRIIGVVSMIKIRNSWNQYRTNYIIQIGNLFIARLALFNIKHRWFGCIFYIRRIMAGCIHLLLLVT
jgi:signal peptidase I